MRDDSAQHCLLAFNFQVKVLRSLELVSEYVDHGDSLGRRVLDHKLIWYEGNIVCCLRLTQGLEIVRRRRLLGLYIASSNERIYCRY